MNIRALAFLIVLSDIIMSDGKSLERVGVVPDEVLLPTARDLGEHKDPILSRAALLLGTKLDSNVAGKFFPFKWRV
jgi:hypothetical protein